MKIIIDDKIPYLTGVLEPFAQVEYHQGAHIRPEHIEGTEALIVRTRTRCNAELLDGSSVRFIGTATIGTDHIDTDYCKQQEIFWCNAPGCNAESVNQYVTAALLEWANSRNKELKKLCMGVVGVGHVGTKVARSAELLGMRVLLNDPPRARSEGEAAFCSLDQIRAEADVISLHVPLYTSGRDKTHSLINQSFLSGCKKSPLIINTCRGEVVDEMALINCLENKSLGDCIIDCWSNEPMISTRLLDLAFIATPHIAGYSRDGKANGSAQMVHQLSMRYEWPLQNWYPEQLEMPMINRILLNGSQLTVQEIIREAVTSTYDIWQDDSRLRSATQDFEKQRGAYPVRREFPAYNIQASHLEIGVLDTLKKMGFTSK